MHSAHECLGARYCSDGPMEGFPLGSAPTNNAVEEANDPSTLPSLIALAGKRSQDMGGTRRDIKPFATWNASGVEGARSCKVP